jgi:hypothetical protein
MILLTIILKLKPSKSKNGADLHIIYQENIL